MGVPRRPPPCWRWRSACWRRSTRGTPLGPWSSRSPSCCSPSRSPCCSTSSASSPPPPGWPPAATSAAGMWVVSAVAVAVLNLDAAVVLCTPLAITVARRWGLDPVAMAFQPALLACLASSALPVSNLTNLIAIAEGRIDAGSSCSAWPCPRVVAVVVGYAGWRVAFRRRALRPLPPAVDERPSPRALLIGAVVLVVLLVGFLPGRLSGIEPWMVVAVVDAGPDGPRPHRAVAVDPVGHRRRRRRSGRGGGGRRPAGRRRRLAGGRRHLGARPCVGPPPPTCSTTCPPSSSRCPARPAPTRSWPSCSA